MFVREHKGNFIGNNGTRTALRGPRFRMVRSYVAPVNSNRNKHGLILFSDFVPDCTKIQTIRL